MKKTKNHPRIIAMYLPQFHQIPENDAWWGEGFTEWTATKSAYPLFPGHDQPRVPADGNYYDLLQKSTMDFQVNLMKEYHVYGMCFYHYYFENGKKILEKPAENLLRWKDIDMPFCFSWANESWARTWSNLRNKLTWSLMENKKDFIDKDDGILLKQDYGSHQDWKEHFHYLLPFFRDKRYIKIDNCPLFIIYKPDDISCLLNMKDCWNELAKEEGFHGIYFIGTNSFQTVCDATLIQEPGYSMSCCSFHERQDTQVKLVKYEDVCKTSVNMKYPSDRIVYLSVFSGFDDTPRRGQHGTVTLGSTPELFERYLRTISTLSRERGNSLVFINAWNEWGEGMYLEPDEKFQYGYLNAVKKVVEDPDGIQMSFDAMPKEIVSVVPIEKKIRRYQSYWRVLDKWMTIREKNGSVAAYLKASGYQRFAIYGLGMLGHHLIAEFEENNMQIAYGIDRAHDTLHFAFPVYGISDNLECVDVIIVTVIDEFMEIREILSHKLTAHILSLEEVLDKI